MACLAVLSGLSEGPYMDAPKYARHSVDDDLKVRLHPYIRTFGCGFSPLSLMGFAGRLLYRFSALRGASDVLGFANHGLTCFAITA